jgi:hypothetical protein
MEDEAMSTSKLLGINDTLLSTVHDTRSNWRAVCGCGTEKQAEETGIPERVVADAHVRHDGNAFAEENINTKQFRESQKKVVAKC